MTTSSNNIINSIFTSKRETLEKMSDFWKNQEIFFNKVTDTFDQFMNIFNDQVTYLSQWISNDNIYAMSLLFFFVSLLEIIIQSLNHST